MKDRLIKMMDEKRSKQDNFNLAREYLQYYVLYLMYREKIYLDQAFLGGTALRILYGIPRFSEDLDFSLIEKVNAEKVAQGFDRIASELVLAGYEMELKRVGRGNVKGAFLRFKGLPHQLGLSPHRDQVFALKVEVDCNPPQGDVLDLKILNKYHLAFSVTRLYISMDLFNSPERPSEIILGSRDLMSGSMIDGFWLVLGKDGVLRSDGREILKYPIGKWFKIRIDFGVGPSRANTFTVSIDEGEKASLQIPSNFHYLNWFAVLTDAENKDGLYYIDNLKLQSEIRRPSCTKIQPGVNPWFEQDMSMAGDP